MPAPRTENISFRCTVHLGLIVTGHAERLELLPLALGDVVGPEVVEVEGVVAVILYFSIVDLVGKSRLARKWWRYTLSMATEHEDRVEIVHHSVLPSPRRYGFGEVCNLHPLASRDVVVPQIVAVIDAINAEATEHHQRIPFACKSVQHQRNLMLPSSAGKLARWTVHATLKVGLSIRAQARPVKAGGVVFALRTELSGGDGERLPLCSVRFRAWDECPIICLDVHVTLLVIRSFTRAHCTLLADQLVWVVRGPVARVPVVQPHVVQVVTVRYPHFASKY